MPTLEEQIKTATTKYITLWNDNNRLQITEIEHKFDLKGQVGGYFCYTSKGSYFRWNMEAAMKYTKDYMVNTVGHEVAHWIVRNINPHATPHGRHWKNVMNSLNLTPERCHNYQLSPARKVTKPYQYTCPNCTQTVSFTVKLFKNMVLRGLKKGGETYYHCGYCKNYINLHDIKTV